MPHYKEEHVHTYQMFLEYELLSEIQQIRYNLK